MAEWLRRWTRNPLGSPRAGSNPADYDKVMSSLASNRESFWFFGNTQGIGRPETRQPPSFQIFSFKRDEN